MKYIIITILCIVVNTTYAIDSNRSGNWLSNTTWVGGIIPTEVNDVVIKNTHIITIYEGDSVNASELWMSNNSVINVYGILVIDSLHINNNSILNVSGMVIISGGVSMANNTILYVNNIGVVTIAGDFTTRNGSMLYVDGNVDIYGDLIGTGCVLGDGSVDVYGTIDSRIIDLSGALPIELLYFKGIYANNEIQLIWATATENNNDYFMIEYSINAVDWIVLDYVDAIGNSINKHTYKYVHNSNISYYYRLSQVDYDGKTTYFNAIFVNAPILNDDIEYEVYDNIGRFIIKGKKDDIMNDLQNNKVYILKSKYNCEKIVINR